MAAPCRLPTLACLSCMPSCLLICRDGCPTCPHHGQQVRRRGGCHGCQVGAAAAADLCCCWCCLPGGPGCHLPGAGTALLLACHSSSSGSSWIPHRRCRCCPFPVWPCPSHSALVCPHSFREVDQFSLWVWLELYRPPTQGDLELLQVQPACCRCLAFCGSGACAWLPAGAGCWCWCWLSQALGQCTRALPHRALICAHASTACLPAACRRC